MSERHSVVTANCEFGRFVREGGIEQFGDVDVMLMQEVQPERDRLRDYLKDTNLEVAVASTGLHLAILVNRRLSVQGAREAVVQVHPLKDHMLAQRGKLKDRCRDRGVVRAQVEGVEYVSMHAPVPIFHNIREVFLKRTAHELAPITNQLIVGGDMNHWPGPRAADRRFADELGLERLDIADKDTYHTKKSSGFGQKVMGRPRFLDGQLDSVYYRDVQLVVDSERVVEIPSDHSAIYAEFVIDE